jgi:hypothetical protein
MDKPSNADAHEPPVLSGEVMTPRRSTRTPLLRSGLTVRQERFATLVAAGSNHTSAYLSSYGPGRKKKTTIYRRAHEIAHMGKVRARVEELRAETSRNARELRMVALFHLRHEMETARSSSVRVSAARTLLRACGPAPKVAGDQKSLRAELEARLRALLPPASSDE